jgi:hypothetical protein
MKSRASLKQSLCKHQRLVSQQMISKFNSVGALYQLMHCFLLRFIAANSKHDHHQHMGLVVFSLSNQNITNFCYNQLRRRLYDYDKTDPPVQLVPVNILTSIDLEVDVLNDLAAHGVCCTVRGVGAVGLGGRRRNILHALLVCVAVADIALDCRC